MQKQATDPTVGKGNDTGNLQGNHTNPTVGAVSLSGAQVA